MLASYPPFYDEDPMKTYQKIMRGKVSFPSHFSKRAVNIISALLNTKPTKRCAARPQGQPMRARPHRAPARAQAGCDRGRRGQD